MGASPGGSQQSDHGGPDAGDPGARDRGASSRWRAALGPLAVVHPFPSVLDAAVVLMLTVLAGGSPALAATAAVAMLALQLSIGSLNDVVDADADAGRPDKPIPAGLIGRRAAASVSLVSGLIGLSVSSVLGAAPFAVAAAGYGAGLAYDVGLKRAGLGWIAFMIAFPLLLVFPWLVATGELPPRWQFLLPIAALAGPALQLSNALVDVQLDLGAGLGGPAVRLGREGAWRLLVMLTLLVYALAWVTLLAVRPTVPSLAAAMAATGGAAVGVLLSRSADRRRREAGWATQAGAVALLGVAWVAAALGG
jgi:4-hydroxybenzoate polyprenyltransferase